MKIFHSSVLFITLVLVFQECFTTSAHDERNADNSKERRRIARRRVRRRLRGRTNNHKHRHLKSPGKTTKAPSSNNKAPSPNNKAPSPNTKSPGPNTKAPTGTPSHWASASPTIQPTPTPKLTSSPILLSEAPTTSSPISSSTLSPTDPPTSNSSDAPTTSSPTSSPTTVTTHPKTLNPTDHPTNVLTVRPTIYSTDAITSNPSDHPTISSTSSPTISPTNTETLNPTDDPTTFSPTSSPTIVPTNLPTPNPTNHPTILSTSSPTIRPTQVKTSSPTDGPTNFPLTSSPTISNTLSPTSSPVASCTLVAELGYPNYYDPDDAPYKGYNYDSLEVGYTDDNYCDAWTSQPWCSYENTNATGTGAYIGNVDNYYKEWAEKNDKIQSEKITITGAASKTTYFGVYHWFYDNDYYPDYWDDHMFAATLSILNEKTGEMVRDEDGEEGWQYPVDIDTPTHIDGKINEDYGGIFEISVTCDEACECYAHDYTTPLDNSGESTNAPISTSTKAPTSSTKAPTSSTKAPTPSTKAPTPSTKAPTVSTNPPTPNPTNHPTISSVFDPITTSPTKTKTSSPTDDPTNFPLTSSPTISNTLSPTSSLATSCTLVAELGYPNYYDPDDAPYKGYNYDSLEVGYTDDNYCDAWTSQPWCTYENTNATGTGAYIGNVDDYYEEWAERDDKIQSEKFTITGAANKTTYFGVYHWFYDNDYYPDYWDDHMFAATLSILNEKTGEMLRDEDGEEGWQYPVDIDTPTHIDGNVNSKYGGIFEISVTCDEACACYAHDYTTPGQ